MVWKKSLNILKSKQKLKNYDPDPDKLTADARLYNGGLKSNIWLYAYQCTKS